MNGSECHRIAFQVVVGNMARQVAIVGMDMVTAVVDSHVLEIQRESHRKMADSCSCVDDDLEDSRRSVDRKGIGCTSRSLGLYLYHENAGFLCSMIVFA